MRLWGRKKESANKQVPVAVGVKIDDNGKIDIVCQWPNVENREEAEKVAREVAYLVINAYKPDIMPYILTTIANHGVKTNSEKLASLIQICINTTLNPVVENDNAPLISPRKAFQVRGDS